MIKYIILDTFFLKKVIIMHALTSTFPTIKTITKASALALSIFTFLLAVETQAKEGFEVGS